MGFKIQERLSFRGHSSEQEIEKGAGVRVRGRDDRKKGKDPRKGVGGRGDGWRRRLGG